MRATEPSSILCLVALCIVALADSCCCVAAAGATAATPSEQLYEAFQFLDPKPSTWSPTVPLTSWGHGVELGGCREPAPELYSVTLSASLMASFTVNRTVRLDLLPLDTPLCGFVLDPSPPAAALPLHVHVNFTGLPQSMQVLSISQSNLTTTSQHGAKWVALTTLPVGMSKVDVSSCDVEGVIDLTTIHGLPVTVVVNVSDNSRLYGAVDLVRVGLCGWIVAGTLTEFLIDLRGTSISTVIAGSDATGAWCVGNNPNRPPGNPISVLTEASVDVVGVDVVNPFLIDFGYYCQAVDTDGGTYLPFINYVTNAEGLTAVRVMRPPYECEMVVTNRFVTYDIGYIYDSASFGGYLWPCLNRTSIYATKTNAIGPQIAIHDSTTAELTLFGECPEVASGEGDLRYFSVSFGESIFMDFLNSGLNVTVRGLWLSPSGSPVFRECFFGWHYFVDSMVYPPSYEHTIYNDMQLISDLQWCFPPTDGTVAYGSWERATLSQNENRLLLRDNQSNTLTLRTFSNGLVVSGKQYCLTTETRIYTWNVSNFSSTLTVTTPAGGHVDNCTYDGIFQFLTVLSPSEPNTFYALSSVMKSLGRCMPLTSAGSVRQWSATASRLQLAPGSFIFGDLIFVDANTSESFTFSTSLCATVPLPLAYCSSVDLFTGSLVLTVAQNRSTTLQYLRRSPDRTLQNVSLCRADNIPLLFDVSGNAFFLAEIVAAWSACFPRESNTASFGSNITALQFIPDKAVVQLSASTPGISSTSTTIEFTNYSCTAMPIQPASVSVCPSISVENASLTANALCFIGLCRPLRSLEWQPQDTAGQSSAWQKGSSPLQGRGLALGALSSIQNVSGGTVSVCYPSCFVDTTNCNQIAFVMSQLLMCYVRKGELLRGAVLPLIPPSCGNNAAVQTLVKVAQRYSAGESEYVGIQCLASGGTAFVTLPDTTTTTSYVLGTSLGASEYSDGTVSVQTPGLSSTCTPCISIWLQKLYPTPLVMIALNSFFNMFLVIVANYVVQPLIGPQIAKAKVKLLVALGALSRREVAAYETWLLRCLKPHIASTNEIEFHIDSVCKIVNAERKKLLCLRQDPTGSTDELDGDSDVGKINSGHQLKVPDEHEETERHTPRSPASRLRYSVASSYMTTENTEQQVESDAKFREVYAKHLMCGARMLGSVGEISLRKLVELRDSCAARPMPIARTNYVRFPTQPKHDTFMTELTAENLLLQSQDDEHSGGYDNNDYVSGFGVSNLSIASADLQLEDAIAAMDADTTAEWIPFVLAHEWMDRQFLSPKDWLLFLQALFVLAVSGRMFDIAVAETGAHGSWQIYNAFYFLILSGSAPVSLVVNAVFRLLYSRQISGDATGRQSKFRTFKAYARELIRDPFFMIPTLLLLPPLVSHVIPGLLIFPFLFVGSLLLSTLTAAMRVQVPEVDEVRGKLRVSSLRTVACVGSRVLFRQTIMFVFVASIQLAFNYSMMLYAAFDDTLVVSTGSWTDIIEVDYNARSIVCALQEVQTSAVTSWNLFYSQFM